MTKHRTFVSSPHVRNSNPPRCCGDRGDRCYLGAYEGFIPVVFVKELLALYPLDPRLDLVSEIFLPASFSWGYDGSLSSRLALAILADCLANDEQAIWFYRRFKDAVIIHLSREHPWCLWCREINQTVKSLICPSGIVRFVPC